MSINDLLLKYGENYEELRIEAFRILREISTKLTTIGGASAVQSVLENEDFYWKHSFPLIEDLAEKTSVSYHDLKILLRNYLAAEKDVQSLQAKFKEIGFETFQSGPKGIRGVLHASVTAFIAIDMKNKKVTVDVHVPIGEEEEYSANELSFMREKKKEIEHFIVQDK